jgi:hypothetical protein
VNGLVEVEGTIGETRGAGYGLDRHPDRHPERDRP